MNSEASKKALLTLSLIAMDRIEERPVQDQIAFYQALAEVLPKPEDRITAERLAFAIGETHALQQRFTTECLQPKPLVSPAVYAPESRPGG